MEINSYLKHYKFIAPNSEIYGGLSKTWDFPLNGAELRMNIKKIWWKFFVNSVPYNFGYEGMIITNPSVLRASNHLENFYDWMINCLNCKKKFRVDFLLSEKENEEFLKYEEKQKFLINRFCPNCKKNLSFPSKFNLLVETNLYKNDDKIYLRPETCQTIFSNFLNAIKGKDQKLPFGIGQIGKSYRNELTLNHGIFRTREFEQMELEFFCEENDVEYWWKNIVEEKSWLFVNKLLNDKNRLKKVFIEKNELPHYSKKTLDFYFNYGFGWGELCSNSYRGNYDLLRHSTENKIDIKIKSKENEFVLPHIVEVSFGLDRLFLAILEDSYREEIILKNKKKRKYLKINPLLSPYFASITFLDKKIRWKAYLIYTNLLKIQNFNVNFEESSSIGKSYRKQDCIGTYYCLTVDFETIEKNTITCRNRDSMDQEIVNLEELESFLIEKYKKIWDNFFL